MVLGWLRNQRSPNRVERFEKIFVPIEEISPSLINAVIAGEDPSFFSHQGFSFEGLRKAYLMNQEMGSVVRGGSTISQQTAKNCFLLFHKSLLRKLIEAYYTFLIEKNWGKKRILECYLNIVELGHGIYGCEAASRHYFHHSAKTLTEEESILLAAMLPSPLTANPNRHTEKYDMRIDWIRKRLALRGFAVWDGDTSAVSLPDSGNRCYGLLYFAKWVILHEWRSHRSSQTNCE